MNYKLKLYKLDFFKIKRTCLFHKLTVFLFAATILYNMCISVLIAFINKC